MFLSEAVAEASLGKAEGGIPIGSVLVKDGKIIGRGHNRRVQDNDPMAHAEINCLHNAGRIGSYKNTISISGSCWQSVTDFQLKFGHVPDPGMIPIMNLKTRKSNMLSFK